MLLHFGRALQSALSENWITKFTWTHSELYGKFKLRYLYEFELLSQIIAESWTGFELFELYTTLVTIYCWLVYVWIRTKIMISDYLTPGRSSITRLSESDKSQRYKEERGQEREVLTKASLPETIPERGKSPVLGHIFLVSGEVSFRLARWHQKRLIQLTTAKLNCWGQGDSI